MGKLSLESKIIEEVSCFNDSIRSENGKAFNIHVRTLNYVCVFNIIVYHCNIVQYASHERKVQQLLWASAEGGPGFSYMVQI